MTAVTDLSKIEYLTLEEEVDVSKVMAEGSGFKNVNDVKPDPC